MDHPVHSVNCQEAWKTWTAFPFLSSISQSLGVQGSDPDPSPYFKKGWIRISDPNLKEAGSRSRSIPYRSGTLPWYTDSGFIWKWYVYKPLGSRLYPWCRGRVGRGPAGSLRWWDTGWWACPGPPWSPAACPATPAAPGGRQSRRASAGSPLSPANNSSLTTYIWLHDTDKYNSRNIDVNWSIPYTF